MHRLQRLRSGVRRVRHPPGRFDDPLGASTARRYRSDDADHLHALR